MVIGEQRHASEVLVQFRLFRARCAYLEVDVLACVLNKTSANDLGLHVDHVRDVALA